MPFEIYEGINDPWYYIVNVSRLQCHNYYMFNMFNMFNMQGLEFRFPVDNEMLRGCYGNRPSCLAKDLPAEVNNYFQIIFMHVKSFQNFLHLITF